MKTIVKAVALMIVALVAASPSIAANVVEEDLQIPLSYSTAQGEQTMRLQALIVRPNDGETHPVAVISHGSPRSPDDRPKMSPRDLLPEAIEFARRGFAALVLLRRGYGQSEGGWAETYGPCENPDYEKAGFAGAADIRKALAALAGHPFLDTSRVLAVGVSAGGFATVALTADPPPGLVGAISFAGGRGSLKADSVCSEERLVAAFAAFGRRSKVPMLWVYAANDHFFGPRLAHTLFRAFTNAGGNAAFQEAPAFGDDGHHLFSSRGIPQWTPYLDRFLAEHFQPTAGSGPAIAPPSALSESGRVAFKKFLAAGMHKAFAVSSSGAFGWRSGQDTVNAAVESAVDICAKNTRQECRVYMVDDELHR